MGDSPDAEVPYKYDFTIPKEMPEGEYVFAWTWFNKVGNREMYMNCASVEVTGGTGDEGFMSTLPDMFVANVGNGCDTPPNKDIEFPNPGNDVDRLNGKTQAFAAPTAPACLTGGGGSGGDAPAPAPTAAPSSSSAPQQPAPTATSVPTPPENPEPTPSLPGGVFITIPTTAPTAAPEPEEPQPEEPKPEEPQPGEGGSGGFAAGEACSTEGAWNCIGGSSFQRCASGIWSEVMAMAGGTTCGAGQSSELKISASQRSLRRSLRRSFRLRA